MQAGARLHHLYGRKIGPSTLPRPAGAIFTTFCHPAAVPEHLATTRPRRIRRETLDTPCQKGGVEIDFMKTISRSAVQAFA
jgi:hypothetical protein